MPARCSFRIPRRVRLRWPVDPAVSHSAAHAPGPPWFVPAVFPVRTPRKWRGARPSLARLGWSGPAPQSARPTPRRGVRVPGASPADPLLTGPSDPAATPGPRRFPADGRLQATLGGIPASPRQSSPRGPAWRSSSPGGRYTPAWHGSASPGFADRLWTRGHTGPLATFSPGCVTGQKRYRILPSGKPHFWAFRSVTQPWPPTILFGQEGFILLRRRRSCEPRQRVTG